MQTYRGSRLDIIRSASSGVGGENFSSVFTFPPSLLLNIGSVEWAGATSSVGKKSGTNLALKREFINKFRKETYDDRIKVVWYGFGVYIFNSNERTTEKCTKLIQQIFDGR